jgi:hypothetical protein
VSLDDIASQKQMTEFEARLQQCAGELLFWLWLPPVTSLGAPGES